mgnify:FL=1
MASTVIMRNFKRGLLSNEFDLDSDTLYVALLNGTQSIATSAFEQMINFSEAQVYETSGTNYVAGGIALSAKPIYLNGSTAVWDCEDALWSNVTLNTDGCVIYKKVTNANDSPLICFIDLYSLPTVGVKSPLNGDFILQFNSLGIFNLLS